jgi:hypothetical protein
MLVGFCILNSLKTPDHRRFFLKNVKCISKKIGASTLYLYGYGAEYETKIEEKTYCLNNNGLDQRNITIRIESDYVEVRTDWLGSFPCYIDDINSEIASHWSMLDIDSRESDNIGSYILKTYSYIPTQRTLKQGVRRMLSNQTLLWSSSGISINSTNADLTLKPRGKISEIIQCTTESLKRDCLKKSQIIIPLSGGYDSRFLASIVKQKLHKKFSSFTYSLLGYRNDCYESKVSKVVAQKLSSPWSSFDLTGYSIYEKTITDWAGGFTHINGDYYEMFAEQVLREYGENQRQESLVISGIVGDLWCGKVKANFSSNIKIENLLYNHGSCLYKWMLSENEIKIRTKAESELKLFFSERIYSNETFLLELVRAKVGLLSFLCYSFERRGLPCSAPFLEKKVVEAVLSLDKEERLLRKWQDNYFESIGIADAQLPKVLLRLNRLAVDEGAKKVFTEYGKLRLSFLKLIVLKLLLSKQLRVVERFFTRRKISEYFLRKLGYKRSDVLISILNVITK